MNRISHGHPKRIYGDCDDFKRRADSVGGAFWLNVQRRCELAMAEKRLGAKIRAEVEAA